MFFQNQRAFTSLVRLRTALRLAIGAPCKGKSAETGRVTFTFALAGRGMVLRLTQGVASLALG